MTTRRQVLTAAGFAAAWLPVRPARAQAPAKQMRNLGGAPTGFGARARAVREGNQTFDVVDHCHSLGLGVVETRLASTDPEAIKKFRQKLDSYNMRVILDIPLPRDPSGTAVFDAAVKAAKEAGAFSLHAAMTQRRYEQYDTLGAFKSDFERCQKTIEIAEPILRKHQLRLGIENHKGWRALEQAAWMKRASSEWVGVHFDFGNNVSLCEDPADTLRILLPYAVASHIKDMAVEPYEDGFLLSEVPLGEGFLNLREMVQTLRTKDPNLPLDLEMITREPLKIPVFTDKYWATFDDSYSPLPGRDLARILALVRKNKPKNPLPRTAGLSPAAQAKLEDENNLKSIHYAQQHLDV